MRIVLPMIPGSKWIKAAVIASYWAAIEIIAGSFLHNLRIPMSGTILSFSSVILLVAFISRWKEGGIVWRAGIITALLKSVSPSGIILGPMVGILSEALLLEVFTLVVGFNLAGYMAGGAMAVMSALFHKVASLLILYGTDLIKILGALYTYSVKQLSLESLPAKSLILIIIGIYALTGILAAWIGFMSGKKAPLSESRDLNLDEPIVRSDKQFLSRTRLPRYSIYMLILSLTVMILLLFMLNWRSNLLTWGVTLVYVSIIGIYYRHSARYLLKPVLWVQFIILTLVASVVLSRISGGRMTAIQGLMTGIGMIVRAVVVLMGFSDVSAELRNPIIQAVSVRHGLSSLYESVNLSFSALPSIIKLFPGFGTFLRRPFSTFAEILPYSERMINEFAQRLHNRPDIIILAGEKQSGKTTFASTLSEKLIESGISCGGILAPGVHEGEKRIGFDLYDIDNKQRYVLCRVKENNKDLSFNRFAFRQDTLEKGRLILHPEQLKGIQIVIIDEVGPLELKNQGWAESIRELCNHAAHLQIWTVRNALIEKVIHAWPIGTAFILDVSEESVSDAVSVIRKQLTSRIQDHS